MLNIRNLSFGFSENKNVLNDLTFQAEKGETIAIVGASGCGKSTFLRLLCGILQKEKTKFLTGSIDINGLSPTAYTKSGKLGFMFQEPTLFPNLTVKENIALPLRLKHQENAAKIDELIHTVGLGDFANYLPKDLSGGMKTRVALARTFATQPEILLLDEPFSALDIRWRFLLYRELEALKQIYSPTVVIVTHDIQEALLLSNHILVFGKNGTILKEIRLEKPLPRVFETDAIKHLQAEYLEIQNLIMEEEM